jgi:hypothetical protein
VPLVNEIFTLTVWKSINPEVILYQKTSQEPLYIDSLNGFTTYGLDSTLLVNGTFYVGWIQATNFFMNIGFDRNSIHSNFMYYKVNALGWQQSSLAGTAMIRPVFADNLLTGITKNKKTQNEFTVYPNPGNGAISIKFNSSIPKEKVATIKVFNVQGQVVHTSSEIENINITLLPKGLYIVQVIGEYNEVLGTQKYLKND